MLVYQRVLENKKFLKPPTSSPWDPASQKNRDGRAPFQRPNAPLLFGRANCPRQLREVVLGAWIPSHYHWYWKNMWKSSSSKASRRVC